MLELSAAYASSIPSIPSAPSIGLPSDVGSVSIIISSSSPQLPPLTSMFADAAALC